jgi:hypothetical protein
MSALRASSSEYLIFFPDVLSCAMQEPGFTREEIYACMGGNFYRVLQKSIEGISGPRPLCVLNPI